MDFMILPYPKELCKKEGFFDLKNSKVSVCDGLDMRVVKATIKIYNDWATAYVDEWFGKNAKFYEKNNIIYADIKANESSLIYWCLQYGEVIELIEPINTREKIKNIIKAMDKRYN